MHKELQKLRSAYKECKLTCQADRSGDGASEALKQLVNLALRFLEKKCTQVDLVSRVAGKEYTAFRRKDAPDKISRPANLAMFKCNAHAVITRWNDLVQGSLPEKDLAQLSYTACPCPLPCSGAV